MEKRIYWLKKKTKTVHDMLLRKKKKKGYKFRM